MSDAETQRWLREEVLPRLQRAGRRLGEAPTEYQLVALRRLAPPPLDERHIARPDWPAYAHHLWAWLDRSGLGVGAQQETRVPCGKTCASGRPCVLSSKASHEGFCLDEFLAPA